VIVVSDTSPITNLSAIGQLDLLRQMYGTIVIPTAVYNEMVGVNKVVPGAMEVQTLAWIETRSVTDARQVISLQENQNNIDLGEAEAIILAMDLKADLLLMDERRGRTVAVESGLKVVGLLGVLLRAKQKGLIPQIKPLMDTLMEVADFRVASQLYAAVLEAAGE
jgi:uncharacterized protein